MQFASPFFLWFLPLLLIPVIIHLFNFRRFKKILFTNVKFLKELKEETNSRSRLKHLLVLFLRILALLFIIFAFAQPFIPKNKTAAVAGQNIVSIFLDNSFSMQSLSKEGTLLDEAKLKAADISKAFSPSTQFQLLTNDFSGIEQRPLNREDFLNSLDRIKISSQSHSFNEILKRQHDFFSNLSSGNRISFIVSDFQENLISQNTEPDTTLQLNLVPLTGNKTPNIYIDSCWLSAPVVQLNQPAVLSIRVKNSGRDNMQNVPLRLSINGLQKSVTTVSVAANSESVVQISFTISQPGWQQGEISISDNPVIFDDTWYFSLSVAGKISIYHISSDKQNQYIHTLFTGNPLTSYTYSNGNSIDYSILKKSNLVVISDQPEVSTGLASELLNFCNEGGSLVIFPDTAADIRKWNIFSTTLNIEPYSAIVNNENNVKRIETYDELFKDVFEKITDNLSLPAVSRFYSLQQYSRSGREVLISLEDGSPFLCRYRTGKGTIYLFTVAAAASWSNFVTNALFVPVLTRAALLSVHSGSLAYTIGSGQGINLRNLNIAGETTLHLINKNLNTDIIPDVRTTPEGLTVFPDNIVMRAGSFELSGNDSVLSIISLNYNRNESLMRFYSATELTQKTNASLYKSFKIIDSLTPDLTKTIEQENKGISLWKYCVMLALLFLLAEIMLLRLLK